MHPVDRLLAIMARLRDPECGCPWDLEQSYETIAPYTIEEAYEVEDAIRRGDREALRDELGDLLLQVVFHAQMAREAGDFEFTDVVRAIADKLVRRHPNVFGDVDVESADAQTRAWEGHKDAERSERARARGDAPPGALDDVALSLPPLTRAGKLQRRAARAGLARPPGPDAVERAWSDYRRASADRTGPALGALLFALVADAGRASLDPDQALRDANAEFEARCRAAERGEEPPASSPDALAVPPARPCGSTERPTR